MDFGKHIRWVDDFDRSTSGRELSPAMPAMSCRGMGIALWGIATKTISSVSSPLAMSS